MSVERTLEPPKGTICSAGMGNQPRVVLADCWDQVARFLEVVHLAHLGPCFDQGGPPATSREGVGGSDEWDLDL